MTWNKAVEQHGQGLAADTQANRGLGHGQHQRLDIQLADDLAGVRGFSIGRQSCCLSWQRLLP